MNYYQILNIPNNANKVQIRLAYKTLAKKYHPDRIKSSDEDSNYFILINEAYSTLIDDDKKKIYDKKINSEFPYEIVFDLLNDIKKFTTFVKPITSYDVVTNINDLYMGKIHLIYYDDIIIHYYPIKSLEIVFEDEILKLDSVLTDNINYELNNYDVYIKINMSELLVSQEKTKKIYSYSLILPDQNILNINFDETEIEDKLIVCYKNKGLYCLPIYHFSDNYDIVNVVRGDLYLCIIK